MFGQTKTQFSLSIFRATRQCLNTAWIQLFEDFWFDQSRPEKEYCGAVAVEKSEGHWMGKKAKKAQRDVGEGREGDRLEGAGGAWTIQLAVNIGTLGMYQVPFLMSHISCHCQSTHYSWLVSWDKRISIFAFESPVGWQAHTSLPPLYRPLPPVSTFCPTQNYERLLLLLYCNFRFLE